MSYDNRINRAEINRLNNAITAEEQNINALFQKIGQTYFEAHRKNPEDNQAANVRGILDALNRAKSYKEQINVLRGIAICPNCKAEVSIQSAFCNFCGTKMPNVQPPAPAADPNVIICRSCGNRCQNTQRFCNQCGAPLVQAAAPAPTPAPAPTSAPAAPAAPAPAYTPVAPEPAPEPVPEAPRMEEQVEEPAPQKKICPNCGTEMEPDCNFCLECGTKL